MRTTRAWVAVIVSLLLNACAADQDLSDRLSPLAASAPAQTDRTALAERLGPASPALSPQIAYAAGSAPQDPADTGTGQPAKTYTLAFRDGSLKDLAEVVIVDMLGQNIVLDPDLSGDVAVDAGTDLTEAQLIDLLRSALSVHGAALQERDGSYFVQAGTGRGLTGAGVQTVSAIPLRHAHGAQIKAVLAEAAPAGAQVLAGPGGRTLIVTGPDEAVRRLGTLAHALDTDGLAGSALGLFPLTTARADVLVGDLKAILPESEGVRARAIGRMNAVLVAAHSNGALRRAQDWIVRLDREGGTARRSLFSYSPQAARAEGLARLVAPLIGARIIDGSDTQAGAPALNGSYGETDANRLITPVADIDLTKTPEPEESGEALTALEAGLTDGPALLPDARTNSFLAYASEREWKTLMAAIERLDRRPAQVMIEATIVEITLNDDLRYGLQFFYEQNKNALGIMGVDALRGLAQAAGLSYAFNATNLSLTIEALSRLTHVKVVSSPKIMVVNNETAALQIGDEVPVATQSAVPTDAFGGRIVNTIEFRDTGVILKITPRVTRDGIVSLDLEQEVSDVTATTTSTIDSPTIRQRRVKSSVDVQSGQTIAMAGLTRDSVTRSKSGVPVLRDIPVVGALFGNGVSTTAQSELLVFLTPRIVETPQDSAVLTDDLDTELDRVLAVFTRGL